MARKHVFPIVGTNLKVIDNDVINSLGPESDIVAGVYNANEDKNVEWYINSSSQQGVAVVRPEKKDHEILFDFNETPDDVYSGISTPGVGDRVVQIFHGPGREGGFSGEIDVDAKLVPGSVFCIGVKNKASDQIVRNFLFYYPTNISNLDVFEFPLRSGPTTSPGLNNGEIGVGKWLTYMFDGKRFVFLGSNNWF